MTEYDTALSFQGNHKEKVAAIRFPMPLTRAIVERGYTRAKLVVTDDGILMKPYIADSPKIEPLPEWDATP